MKLHEARLLRIFVAAAALVPISAGLAGIVYGAAMVPGNPAGESHDLDSHFRYLSGLLLGIGIGYVSTIPRIEDRSARFQLLTCIVVAGGLGRMISWFIAGVPSSVMTAALIMELAITPGLACWQHRVARLHADQFMPGGNQ